MRYELKDLHGDVITVTPIDPEGVIPQCHVRFELKDGDKEGKPYLVDMVLDDRRVADFKQAMNRAIRESRRTG